MKKHNFLLLVFLLNISLISAQAPYAFQYQAALRDAGGQLLVNQQISLRMSIIADSIGGNVLYQESFLRQTNAFGLIFLEIGQGNVITGNFTNIGWGEKPHFLEVAIDENAGKQLCAPQYYTAD